MAQFPQQITSDNRRHFGDTFGGSLAEVVQLVLMVELGQLVVQEVVALPYSHPVLKQAMRWVVHLLEATLANEAYWEQ